MNEGGDGPFEGERLTVMGVRTSTPQGVTIRNCGGDWETPFRKILIPSRIAHVGEAGAKGSSPKKVKVKELGEKQTLTTRSCKTSTSVPWMWHQVVLEWVSI